MPSSPEDFRLKAALQATELPEKDPLPVREIGTAAGTLLGAVAGSFLAPGAGTAVGASVGGALGGLAGGLVEEDEDKAGGEATSTLTDSARLAAALGEFSKLKETT